MNKRYILKNSDGVLFACVIDPQQEEKTQWERIFAIEKGHGLTAERWGDQVKITDYFHAETRAAFQIISEEETREAASCDLTRISG